MSDLPASIREDVEAVTGERGLGSAVTSTAAVAGGCISRGVRATLEGGADLFVKWGPPTASDMFASEVEGLVALAQASSDAGAGLRIPIPIATGGTPDGAWLALEYVPPGPATPGAWETLGRGLATLHSAGRRGDPGRTFGWPTSNWIGSLPQSNGPSDSWPDFWATQRIEPQLERARASGFCRERVFDGLLSVVPEALRRIGSPGLVHGDLWSGNAFFGPAGQPVLVDPAVYVGDGDVDLAMSELFGGFDPRFYAAYDEIRPRSPSYRSHLRDLYQLYWLLVHVNLFGAGYEPGARAAAARVVAALA